eukprot:CAMPEP_0204275862 /NCGR_PEP_ID=MMETSP0468-20130131/26866_1 /ASSEMBLY_ACC=CAM_ASM_000383 /TAXON_ID=2969 /ORGANISM="Oxyrrhis marina" /LENGTH=301 /DNA_ID=CAMNT_0051252317 /DNA_START=29 /DNA_END=931 /DNA_ORIENTATION=-
MCITSERPGAQPIIRAVEGMYRDRIAPTIAALRPRYEALACLGLESDYDLIPVAQEADLMVKKLADPVDRVMILLRRTPKWFKGFVDPLSTADPYPQHMWNDLSKYLGRALDKEPLKTYEFGGRYGAAVALHKRRLRFLQSYTLGEVVHIVQLAMGGRQLLGYSKGKEITTWENSVAAAKKRAAQKMDPAGDVNIASWQQLRQAISQVLRDHQGCVRLSQLKDAIAWRCGSYLAETAFGYDRMSHLLVAPELEGVCAVRVREAQLFVVRGEAAGRQEPAVVRGVTAVAVRGVADRAVAVAA